MRITRIVRADIIRYPDGHTRASVDWIDQAGNSGNSSGFEDSLHMTALLNRARREGVQVNRREAV